MTNEEMVRRQLANQAKQLNRVARNWTYAQLQELLPTLKRTHHQFDERILAELKNPADAPAEV